MKRCILAGVVLGTLAYGSTVQAQIRRCMVDDDCPGRELCHAGVCTEAERRQPDPPPAPASVLPPAALTPDTSGTPVPSCQRNRDCHEGMVCLDGGCVWSCRDDGDCQARQQCVGGVCAEVSVPRPPATASPTARTTPSVEETTTFTFTSNEPGEEVAEWSNELWLYATLCVTPCTLQLTPGAHALEIGGWEADVVATGTPQDWRYESGEEALWGWSIAGVVTGPLMIAGGGLILAAFENETEDGMFAFGGVLVGLGAVLVGLGIWGIVAAEPVTNVTSTGYNGEVASTSTTFLPSLAVYPMEDGRTAWGLGLSASL